MNSEHSELQLLQTIHSSLDSISYPDRISGPDGQSGPDNAKTMSQRDLAKRSGLSLGMTNALLRRFVERGWVKLLNASGRTWGYVLTPEGAEEIVLRSLRYFARAAKSASLYRDKIDAFVRKAALDGLTALVLEGPAELDFLFDYTCERHGLAFVKNPKGERREQLAADSHTIFVMADFAVADGPGAITSGAATVNLGAATVRLSTILVRNMLD